MPSPGPAPTDSPGDSLTETKGDGTDSPGDSPAAPPGDPVWEAAAVAVAAWRAQGRRLPAPLGPDGTVVEVWWADLPPVGPARGEACLLLHGFPTCSYDWHHTVAALRNAGWRVVCLDFPGFGSSAKPDRRYGIGLYADAAEAVARAAGLDEVALLTHDLGDSVGGELCARDLEGRLGFGVSRRVLTNGSIYMDLVQLTPGQQMLLDLPDARLDPAALGLEMADAFRSGVAATCAPDHRPGDVELAAAWLLAAAEDGHTLLTRTIRYIEDRRTDEHRYTGAIEAHPSPLGVIWGDVDPVARYPMARRLCDRRPDARLVTLTGIGHYPMLEAPESFATATVDLLG